MTDKGINLQTLLSSLSGLGSASSDLAALSLTANSARVLPLVDYSNLANHVFYGDALRRFNNTITNIQDTYPIGLFGGYASSLCAQNVFTVDKWLKEATGFDLWVLDQLSITSTITASATNTVGEVIPLVWVKRNSANAITGSQTAIVNSISARVENFEKENINVFDTTPGSADDHSVYSSTGEETISRASKLITLLPAVLSYGDGNEVLERLMGAFGDELDELKTFVDQIQYIKRISYDSYNRTPDKFLPVLAREYGIDLFQSAITNAFESYYIASSSGMTNQEIAYDVWNRILNNIIHLLKTKGIKECIEAIGRLYGVDANYLRVNEYSVFNRSQQIRDYEEVDTPVLFSTGDVYVQVPTGTVSAFDFSSSANFTIESRISATSALLHKILVHPHYTIDLDASGRLRFYTTRYNTSLNNNIASNTAFSNGFSLTNIASGWIANTSITGEIESTTVHTAPSAQKLIFSTTSNGTQAFAQNLTGLTNENATYGATAFVYMPNLTGFQEHVVTFRIGPNSGGADFQSSVTSTSTGTYQKLELMWNNTASNVWIWLTDSMTADITTSKLGTSGNFEAGFTSGIGNGWLAHSSITGSVTTANVHTGTSAQSLSFSANSNNTQAFAFQLSNLSSGHNYGATAFINIQTFPASSYNFRVGPNSGGADFQASISSATTASYVQLQLNWANTATSVWLWLTANNAVSGQVFFDTVSAALRPITNTAYIDSVCARLIAAGTTAIISQASISSYIQKDGNWINTVVSRSGDSLKLWTLGVSGSGSGAEDVVILASAITAGVRVLNIDSSAGAGSFGTYFPGSGSFSGYNHEVRSWNVALEEEDLKEHTRNFQSISFLNSTASNSATFGSLKAQYRLRENVILTGGYNFIVDSTTAGLTAIPRNFQAVKRYVVIPDMKKFVEWYPTGLSIDNDKIRQVDSRTDIEDVAYLSVHLTPINAVNREIKNTYQNINIKELLGTPEDLYRHSYTGPIVTTMQNFATRKSGSSNLVNINSFTKATDNFNDVLGSIFTFIEQFLSAKTNLVSKGLLIEDHILHRSKLQREDYHLVNVPTNSFVINNHFLTTNTSTSAGSTASFQGFKYVNGTQMFLDNSLSSTRNLQNLGGAISSRNTPGFSFTRTERFLPVKIVPSSTADTELEITVNRLLISPTASPSAYNGNISGRVRLLRNGKPFITDQPALRFNFPSSGNGVNYFKVEIGDIANGRGRIIEGADLTYISKLDSKDIQIKMQLSNDVKGLSADTTSLSGTIGVVPIQITNLFSNVAYTLRLVIGSDHNLIQQLGGQDGVKIVS